MGSKFGEVAMSDGDAILVNSVYNFLSKSKIYWTKYMISSQKSNGKKPEARHRALQSPTSGFRAGLLPKNRRAFGPGQSPVQL